MPETTVYSDRIVSLKVATRRCRNSRLASEDIAGSLALTAAGRATTGPSPFRFPTVPRPRKALCVGRSSGLRYEEARSDELCPASAMRVAAARHEFSLCHCRATSASSSVSNHRRTSSSRR